MSAVINGRLSYERLLNFQQQGLFSNSLVTIAGRSDCYNMDGILVPVRCL